MEVFNERVGAKIVLISLLLASFFIAGCIDSPTGTTEVHTKSPPGSIPETHTNGNLSSEEIQELERLVFEKTNQERTKRGREKLVWDKKLARVSNYHAWNMAEKDFESHIEPDGDSAIDRLKQFGYTCETDDLGEVISIGYHWSDSTLSKISDKAMISWMESEGHRGAILSEGGRLAGVGAYNHASGEIFIVQLFCTNVEPLSGSQDSASAAEDRAHSYRK